MEKKSKVLIIGATGNLGFHLAQFSLKFGHPTFILIRDSAFTDPVKLQKLNSLTDAGATILKVALYLSLLLYGFSFYCLFWICEGQKYQLILLVGILRVVWRMRKI